MDPRLQIAFTVIVIIGCAVAVLRAPRWRKP